MGRGGMEVGGGGGGGEAKERNMNRRGCGGRGKIAIINPNLSVFPTYQYNIQRAGVRTVLVPVNPMFQENKVTLYLTTMQMRPELQDTFKRKWSIRHEFSIKSLSQKSFSECK